MSQKLKIYLRNPRDLRETFSDFGVLITKLPNHQISKLKKHPEMEVLVVRYIKIFNQTSMLKISQVNQWMDFYLGCTGGRLVIFKGGIL